MYSVRFYLFVVGKVIAGLTESGDKLRDSVDKSLGIIGVREVRSINRQVHVILS